VPALRMGRQTAAVTRREAPESVLQNRLVFRHAYRAIRQTENGSICTPGSWLTSINKIRSRFASGVLEGPGYHKSGPLTEH
jgi:hypothetical protein